METVGDHSLTLVSVGTSGEIKAGATPIPEERPGRNNPMLGSGHTSEVAVGPEETGEQWKPHPS